MTAFLRNESGFTLIEVLVSIAILMIVGAFLFDSLSFSYGSNTTSKEITVASNLAHEELERVKSLTWNEIMSNSRATVASYTGYERQVDVINQSTTPPLKRVTVTVYWKDRSIQYTTLLSDYGR